MSKKYRAFPKMGKRRPALGIIELKSIARGYVVCDTLVKKANVRILQADHANPGKFFVLFYGDEASVEESLHAGLQNTQDDLLDFLYIPNLHPQVFKAIAQDAYTKTQIDAVGIVETSTITSAIAGADAAIKSAEVVLIRLKILGELGGKAYFILTGTLENVEASILAALKEIEPRGFLIRREIIPAPTKGIFG